MRALRPLAVAFISASTLTYEILLVRVFAIEEFHHFAYMAIGVAMLGLGAAGTVLALVRREHPRRPLFAWAAALTPLALIASPVLVHRVPLDVTQLAWDAAQWPRLGLIYLLLAIPFGLGGLTVLLALAREPQRTGLLYGAGFLGSGLGAVLALVSLWVFVPTRALAVPALLAAPGALAAALADRARGPRWVAAAALAASLLVVARPAWRLHLTPYKGLPQVEAYPDARRSAERTSPLGWVVAVQAAAFRYAPGLSLAYDGEFPRQTALFVDGQLAGAANHFTAADTGVLGWLPTALPYAAGPRRRVLIVGAGGGMDVWVALYNGARRVEAAELNPDIVALSAGDDRSLRPGSGEVEWVIGDARSHVAGTDERFDLISLGPGEAFGAVSGGVHALNEDFLHTVDAYVDYLGRLSEDGMLAVTRWLTVPPRQSVRAILTAAESLRRVAGDGVGAGLIVVRSWATVTVLVKPAGFSAVEVESLAEWSASRRLDVDWHPGITAPHQRFNILDEPVLYRAAGAAVAGPGTAAEFAGSYPFAVAAVGDARPYPHHFLRPGSIGALFRQGAGDWLPFAEWGVVALLATLVQSLVLSFLLLILPVLIAGRGSGRVSRGRLIGYFGAIGFAYLAAEIAAIQQLGLLLGHPVYSVSVVLAVFLLASGVGSIWSDRRGLGDAWKAGVALALLLAAYAAILLGVVHRLHPASLPVRAIVAGAVLVPLAFVMGLPFPIGMRDLCGGERAGVAWAWAANGFASVVAAPLAALLALEAGSKVLFLGAATAYGTAAALQRLHRGY